MARFNALLLPDRKSSVAISQIARATAYENGAGIFNMRDKMIAWIPCETEQEASTYVQLINDILNNPGRAKQPDWFGTEDEVIEG